MAENELVDVLERLVEQARIANLLALLNHPILEGAYGGGLGRDALQQFVEFHLDDDGGVEAVTVTERVGAALGIPPRRR